MPEQTTIQIGLRVPETVNLALEKKAQAIGVSKNALISMLIDLGLRAYESRWQISLPDE